MTLPNVNDDQHFAALESVFQNLGDGILVLDRELNIVLANPWVQKRYSGTALLAGQKCYAALHGRQEACPACPCLRTLKTGLPQTQMARVSTGVDQYQWLELSAYLIGRSSAEAIGVIEQIKDVTKLSQTESRLRDEAGLVHVLVDESRDGIVVLDLNGKVCQANEQFARMIGSTVEETRQTHVWDWDIQWEKERVLDILQRAEIASERFEIRLRGGTASPVHIEIASNGVTIAGKKFVYWVCRDITDKKAFQEQIRELNIRDPLTALYNRRYLLERLAESSAEFLRGGHGFCISVLDLDNFKTVNDVHGAKAADLALAEFAHTIGAAVRPYDLVGRFGGDELIIVSKKTTQLETEAMIRRLMATVHDKDFTCEGNKIRLSFSCGLAYCGESPEDAFSIESIIARANERLTEAKLAGGDRYVSGVAAAE